MKILLGVIALLSLASLCPAQWIKQNVDTTASLRGLSVVNGKVIWASGTGGTVIRTIDGGKTWKVMTVPGAEKLDFRDIEAFDANTAYILSIGNGELSRIYKTVDGGKNWKDVFTSPLFKAFFDAIGCWAYNNCISMSDPVDGKFILTSSDNGGASWKMSGIAGSAAAKNGEAAFAASGTCLITQKRNTAFIVSGGNDARVFKSTDRGKTWSVHDTPIVKGSAGSGIFSVAMFDRNNGVIVGGNYEKPDEAKDNLAFTVDGGETWKLGAGLTGYRSGVTYVDGNTIIAVGTNGSDFSRDGGKTWLVLGTENLNSVRSIGSRATWAVGPNGAAFRLNVLAGAGDSGGDLAYSVQDLRLSRSDIELTRDPLVKVVALAPQFDTIARYVYTVTGGIIKGNGPSVTWDLSGVAPGKYAITAAISELQRGKWQVFGRTYTREVVVH